MKISITLQEISEQLEAKLIGNPEYVVSGINNIFEATEKEITFLSNPKYADKLPLCNAGAILVSEGVTVENKNLLQVKNPRLSFSHVMRLFFPDKKESGKISDHAFVSKTATIESGVTLYPNVYIGKNAIVGKNTTLYPGVYIGDHVKVGEHCLFHANVVVHDGSIIGNRVLIHSGSIIAGEGFGFEQHKEVHVKVPQIGNVIIEDDVEIGSLCAIDRGSLQNTTIGKGTKFDNFVHIGHNCSIGKHNLFVSQTGLSGTVTTGQHVYFGGRAATMDNLTIEERAVIGPNAVATNHVKKGEMLFGYPARPYKEWKKATAMFYKADEQRKKVIALEKRIQSLEKQLQK